MRVFLRPSAFPSRSATAVAISGNESIKEGAAGLCFCTGRKQQLTITADPDSEPSRYVRESGLPMAKVRMLKRKALFYLAYPLVVETGPAVGVVVFDNSEHARILDDPDQAECDRVEHQADLLVSWVAQLLRKVPAKILKRI